MSINKKYIIIVISFTILISTIYYPLNKIDNKSNTNNNTKQEYPNLSSNEILIDSPLNFTYTEPMSGYYPGSIGFEDDFIGTIPDNWWYHIPDSGSFYKVVSEWQGHKYVYEIRKNGGSQKVSTSVNFTSAASAGSVDFWLYKDTDSNIDPSRINLEDGYEVNYFTFGFEEGTLYIGTWQDKQQIFPNAFSKNMWHYVRVDFNFSLGWQVQVDDTIYGEGYQFNTYVGTPTQVMNFQIESIWSGCNPNYGTWVDAIGNSWDPNYSVGNNLHEGLLLGYNNTNLSWQGYSLDGQLNKTIYGNYTIPFPSNGQHSIQVFGNDTGGNNYESEVRYFMVNYEIPTDINIVTPENMVYNEPMSGYYHATYGFENEIDRTLGSDILFLDEYYGQDAWAYCDILTLDGPSNGHNKILNMRDAQGSLNTWGVHHIDYPQSSGTIEFYLWSNNPSSGSSTKRHYIQFRALNNTIAFQMMIQLHDNRLRYYNGASWQDLYTVIPEVWYHHFINFNCEAGINGQFTWIISSETGSELARVENIEFENDLNTIDEIYLGTVVSDYSGTTRWDAFGFSWDSNYEIGDNRNETILLSYDTEVNLDWKAYSLDGQENITIFGNATLPKLNNGLHSIQVFGNDSSGNIYKSDIRYFSTTYWNHNVPTLTNGSLYPSIGDQLTEFNFQVLYTDQDNDTPAYVNVVINQTSYLMAKVSESDDNYTDGCLYQYFTYLLPSEFNYSYYFECSDNYFIDTTLTFNNLKVEESNFYNPILKSPNVAPSIGNHSTQFKFTVWYFDDDNNFPSYVNITLNSTTYSMQPVDINDLTAFNGIEYYFECYLTPGYYQFQIICSDGYFTNTTDWINAPEVDPFYSTPQIQLIYPLNSSTSFSNLFNFTWQSFDASFGTINYTLQISSQEDFSIIFLEINNIEEKPNITNLMHYIDYPSGDYYWRVRPYYQTFIGEWSEVYKFHLIYNEYSPTLNSLSLEPLVGDKFTLFNFSITYQDNDNNSPYFVNVIINGTPYSMEIVDPLDDDYTDGFIYYYTTTLPFSVINYTYSFECSDGKFTTSTATFNNLEVNQANYNSPHLFDPQVTPQIGGLSTIFHFQVVYMDLDDNFPEFVNITIDDHTHAMIQYDLLDTIATDGILYYYDTILDIGLHTFQINCSDGLFFNSTNILNSLEVNPLIGIEPVELYEPVFHAQITSNIINFSWYSLNLIIGPVNYTLEISDINDFSNILYEITDILETTSISNVLVPISLPSDDFFWRVRATYGDYNGTWSNPSRFTYMINSEAPLLTLEEITPSSGTESTVFKISVLYSDSDNNVPNYVRILINGIPHNMTMVDPNDDDFTNGCLFQFLTFIDPSETACIISFECSDGFYQYSTSNFEGPIVEFDEIPNNNLGENNFNSANTFAMVMTIGITIGCLIPFIVFTEILTKKVKLGTLSSKKIKKKEIKSK